MTHDPPAARASARGRIASAHACRARMAGLLAAATAALTLIAGGHSPRAAGDGGLAALLAPTTDFSRPEAGEARPGGEATSVKNSEGAGAFSNPSGNMPLAQEIDFRVGNAIFKKTWVPAPSSAEASDGLGPLFNARSCQACHLRDGRGQPPAAGRPSDEAVSMLLRLSIPPETEDEKAALAAHAIAVVPEPTYGTQLQNLAIQGHAAEGRMQIAYQDMPVTLAGGETIALRKPSYTIADPGYGPLHPKAMLSPRVASPMIGLGLIEAVPADLILQYADAEDRDGDGISGRPNLVWSQEAGRAVLGRFGWKAGAPSVRQQIANAMAGDMGLSTPLVPKSSGDCTEHQRRCLEAPNGNDKRRDNVEAGGPMLDLVAFYARNLAVPRRRKEGDVRVLAGKRLFYSLGCARCHRPKLMTGEAALDQTHLAHQLIWPYSDLLLHDMGEGLADGRPEGAASGREWRTAPLWGIGLTGTVSGHEQLLHDGRARGVAEAILWHGGEAKRARDGFAALSKEERDKLIAFVNSL